MYLIYSFLAVITIMTAIAITRRVSAGALTMKNVGWGVGTLVAVVTLGFVWQNWETDTVEEEENPPLAGIWRLEVEILGMPETKNDYPVDIWVEEEEIEAMVINTRSVEWVFTTSSGRFLRTSQSGEVPIGGTWELDSNSSDKKSFWGTYEYVAPRGKDAGETRQGRFLAYCL